MISGAGSRKQNEVVAVIDIRKVWRLKMTNESCFVVKTKNGDFAFLDHSTNPSTGTVLIICFDFVSFHHSPII